MNNSESPSTIFTPERDKYGRSTHALRSYPAYRTLGYVVRLPKAYIEGGFTPGAKYFTNNWAKQGDDAVTHYPTLKAAKAGLLAEVAA